MKRSQINLTFKELEIVKEENHRCIKEKNEMCVERDEKIFMSTRQLDPMNK